MLIYLIIYIPFVLCSLYDFNPTSSQKKNRILWFWVIVFTLFRGLRWEIGTDWDQFYYVYQHSYWENIFSYDRAAGVAYTTQLMDYGYMFINALFHELGFSYTVFLLVTNFWIMYCFKDFAHRHTKYPIIVLIMLMSIGVPFPIRQTIALATSIWAIRFIVERRANVFLCAAIISGLIHKGSFIIIPFYFIPPLLDRYNLKWWLYAGLYLSTFVIAEFLGQYIRLGIGIVAAADSSMHTYAESYLTMETTSIDFGKFSNSAFGGISFSIFFILLLYIKEKYPQYCSKQIRQFNFFFFLYAISAIIRNLIRQSSSDGFTEILTRITVTFDMFPLIFPLIFLVFEKKYPEFRRGIQLLFICYMLYKYWNQIPASFYSFVYIPYKSIIF